MKDESANSERKEKSARPLVSPTHASWLVKHRANNQRVTAELYRILRKHSDGLEHHNKDVQNLTAVAFSLWRSAFLSDKTGYSDDTTDGAIRFLSEVLENNSIAYSQERNSKDWTFNYYVANARYRLLSLKEKWPDAIGQTLPAKGEQTPKVRWEYLQASFERAVRHFASVLDQEAAIRRQPNRR